jgi:hypothetical protein
MRREIVFYMKPEDLFELNKANESMELKEKKNYIEVDNKKTLGLE